jgi:two-component system chemotaxis response regulator CheY
MKVMVVDDDIVSRMVLMHLIDNCGQFEIVEADDGEDAWLQLEAGMAPAILFCDLRMPRLSGMQLLERMKASARLAPTPFVLVTSANDGATVQQASALGAAGYIVKPFQPDQVRAQLAACGALSAAEAPFATMQRLGIDGARLLVYLNGLRTQLDGAVAQLDAAITQPGAQLDVGATFMAADLVSIRGQFGRIHTGCMTLGLHVAATQLAALRAGDIHEGNVRTALASARLAVESQIASVSRLAT